VIRELPPSWTTESEVAPLKARGVSALDDHHFPVVVTWEFDQFATCDGLGSLGMRRRYCPGCTDHEKEHRHVVAKSMRNHFAYPICNSQQKISVWLVLYAALGEGAGFVGVL
jgi:hypothetical protein